MVAQSSFTFSQRETTTKKGRKRGKFRETGLGLTGYLASVRSQLHHLGISICPISLPTNGKKILKNCGKGYIAR